MDIKRVFLIVLDSYGIGNAPDAADFGDEGSNTLATIVKSEKYHTPNMCKLIKHLFWKTIRINRKRAA